MSLSWLPPLYILFFIFNFFCMKKKMMTVMTKLLPLSVMVLFIGGFVLLTKAAPVYDIPNRIWTDTFDTNSSTLNNTEWDNSTESISLNSQIANYPQLLGSISLNANATKITYDNNNAVYVGAGTDGVIKVDVTNPASMSITGSNVMEGNTQDVYFSNVTGTDTIYVPERLYVSATTNNPDPEIGGIEMLNASTMGYTKYPADNTTMDLYDYSTIKMNGTIGYAGVVDPSNYIGVETIDFSGPTHVGVLSSTDMANQPVIYDSALDSSYFYVTHDIAPQNVNVNGVPVTYTGMVTVFDVTNTNSPATTDLTYKTEHTPYAIVSSGGYVYVANGTSIDILDSGFAKVGSIDTGAEVRDMVVNGSTLYVANGANGLSVYNIQTPTSPLFIGGMSNLSGGTAYGVYYDSSTQRAYVADGVAGVMVVYVPPVNLSLKNSWSVPSGVDHALYGGYAYVANGTDVTIVNLGNGTTTNFNINGSENIKGVDIKSNILYVAYDTGSTGALSTYSLANPIAPAYVRSFTSHNNSSTANDVVVGNGKAYILEGYAGVEIVNLTTSAITTMGTVTMAGAPQRGFLDGDNLYVATQNGGMQILNTTSNTIIASYATTADVRDITVVGNNAYLAEGNNNQSLEVVNVTNVNSPSHIAYLGLGMDAQGIAGFGNYVYIAGGNSSSQFAVIDITNPSTPAQVYHWSPGAGTGKTVSVKGNYIYVTSYGRGLDIYGTSYLTPGTAISPTIAPNPPVSNKWGFLTVDALVPMGSTITYDVLDAQTNNNNVLLSFNSNANVFDLRSLSGITYPAITLRANFDTSNVQVTPQLNEWSVSWDPTVVSSTSDGAVLGCTDPINLTFSHPMDTAHFNVNSYVAISPDLNLSGIWNDTNTVLTLSHTTAFNANMNYSVRVSGGVDASGQPVDNIPFTFSFTTSTSCSNTNGNGNSNTNTNTNTNGNVNGNGNTNTNGNWNGNTNTNRGGGGGGGMLPNMNVNGVTTGGNNSNNNSPVCSHNETPSVPFTDITGHWAETYIEALRLRCILSGVSAGVFAPNQSITRAEFTKIVLKGFHIPVQMTVTEKPFPDVETTAWYAPYIAAAKAKGIVMGYPNGNFKPDQAIDRVEALKILLLASGVDLSDTVVTPEKMFIDTFADEWYAVYVVYSKEHNIITGYRDTAGNLTGYFGPGNAITRAESAKVLYSVMQTLGLL